MEFANPGSSTHTLFADIQIELRLTAERIGKQGQAEECYTRAWETFGEDFGQKHPKTLQSLNYIGGSLWRQGR